MARFTLTIYPYSLGSILALASAALFGLNSASIRRGVLTGSILHALAITVPLGVPLFALAYVAFGGLQSPSSLSYSGWVWFALAGVVHFAFGRYGNYRAMRAVGAAQARANAANQYSCFARACANFP